MMYRKAYRGHCAQPFMSQLTHIRSEPFIDKYNYILNMTGYENAYRKEIQALNIGKRTMELSMLEYSERMREISLRRGQNNMSLTSLYNRVPGTRKWGPNNKTQDDLIIEELPPWKAFAEKSKRTEEKAFLPEDSQSEKVMFGLGLLDANSRKKNENKTPKRFRRPISDTPLAQNRNDSGHMSTMSSPVSHLRSPVHIYPRFSFNNFAEGTSVRPGSTRILDLSVLSESTDNTGDATLDSEELREGPEITPFPDIEVQATPMVLHKPKLRKKRKDNRTKKEAPKDQNNDTKLVNNSYSSRLKHSQPGKYNYHFKYSQVVEDKVFFEQNGRIVTIRKGLKPDIVLEPEVDVIRLQHVKGGRNTHNKKDTSPKLTQSNKPASPKAQEQNDEEKDGSAEAVPKPVLKTDNAQEGKSPKKVVQFGPDMIREVTKYTFPQSDASDRDLDNDFDDVKDNND